MNLYIFFIFFFIIIYRDENLVEVNVKGNENLKELHSIVIGRTGIVYQNSHEIDLEDKKFSFTFPITKWMAPECNLIVYYMQSKGEIIYDRIRMKFDAQTDNNIVS